MREILQKIFREDIGVKSDIGEIKKLHGDASNRTYYRAILSNGQTYIVMEMPAGRSSASEEITNFKGKHAELPFINVARYLKSLGVPVPDIYAYDETARILVIEDLGDDMIAKRVALAGTDERLSWYRKAIDLLISLQKKTRTDNARNCVAFQRSFDATLFNWEFDHFLEYGIEARLGIKVNMQDRNTFLAETRGIAAKIENLPRSFTHRDFQSRNILIKDGKLYLIDFQDALMGPAVYDLAALLRDSYIELGDTQAGELVEYYASLAGRDAGEVRQEFDIVTVQRKLKDAGRFVYIDRVKGNPNFLQFIPASLNYARSALARLPEYKELGALLEKYIPEWK